MEGKFDIKVQQDMFNSEIFGLKMGNIVLENASTEDKDIINALIYQKLKDARKEGFEHLTCKVDTNYKKIVQSLEKNGFILADTLIEYLFDFEKCNLSYVRHKCEISCCQEKDIETLKDISRNAFKIDRFHSDDTLEKVKADLYYEKWIENSYRGLADKVFVARYNNEAVGYTTGKVYENDEYGHLVLSAVSDKYRGLGIYTSMIYEGVRWLQEEHGKKIKGVIVGTQINNIAVQKAWIKLGFSVLRSSYVFQNNSSEERYV